VRNRKFKDARAQRLATEFAEMPPEHAISSRGPVSASGQPNSLVNLIEIKKTKQEKNSCLEA
jgi:hypothetical protein